MTEGERVGWHHWLNGHEFEQALGVGDGQGGLACCYSWGHKELTWLTDCIILSVYIISEWSSGFPYFLQIKPEFYNQELMNWATVSSQSCLCWLCRASPSSAAKTIINVILALTFWWCPGVELSLVFLEEDACYDLCILCGHRFDEYNFC